MKSLAQVKGGFFAQYGSQLPSIEPTILSMDHKRVAQALAHKTSFEFRQILDTLILSGVGATATLNYYEIEPKEDMGGKRNIVATPIINRTVTGNDIADARETVTSLSSDTYTPNPVYNGDRNPLGTR